MKIGVLTFHRCINYGSYWQASCLANGLRQRGHEAVLLDHQSSRMNRAEWRCALRPEPPRPPHRQDYLLYAEKTRRFFEALTILPLSYPFALDRPQEIEDVDLIVVGSDEVWNLRHPWYGGCPLFYGEGLPSARIASYAASFGNYTFDRGLAGLWREKLRRFSAISIRDENSRALVRQAIDRDATLVLDPCLQFPPGVSGRAGEARPPYVAVYGHSFPKWFSNAICDWAASQGITVVSIGYRNDWADEQRITAGPNEFASLMADAQAVATNFFHGCIFSLLNRKPFVCVSSDYRSTKLMGLTHCLAAERHLVAETTPMSLYAEILGSEPEDEIYEKIARLRQQSDAYLDAALS
jgi:hypothetical protein